MSDLPAPLADLSYLSSASKKAADYFAPLLDSDDEILRVGAWSVLLDRGDVDLSQYDRVVELASYGAIRARAFRFFESNWDHDYAERIASLPGTPETDAEARAMQATLDCDPEAALEAQRLAYLATGDVEVLHKLIPLAEEVGGWRSALPVAVKVAILHPHDPGAASDLLETLYSARQADLLEAALQQYQAAGLHAPITLLYSAALSMLKGNPRRTMQLLQQLARIRADILQKTMKRNLTMRLTAEALEKMGDFPRAYAAYSELKKNEKGEPVRLDQYYSVIRNGEAYPVPPLPSDPKTNYFVMTGFPRSGTTLLENILAAHPRIETFEETPAGSSMRYYIDRLIPRATNDEERAEIYLASRERYYDELDRRRRKESADIFVDKMPMRSGEAKLIVKVFPERRYIFSIRHPFDVVLSCFKQYFSRNMAMDHFRSFDSAVALYDFVMTQWFETFTMDDPRVHYLRYDKLVTEFDQSMREALGFLGADWDEDVREFASAAEERKARTPSYQKVRQGLSIGVQTQWRNYGFLFQSPVAKPLHKWAEFFGYERA